MMKLGTLEKAECEELQKIYMRKTALDELLLSIENKDNKETLFRLAVTDLAECKKEMAQWWDLVSAKYGWTYGEEDKWEVRFNTQEVFLHKKQDAKY